MKFIDQLEVLVACRRAKEWVGEQTFEEAWVNCPDPTWLVWLLLEVLPIPPGDSPQPRFLEVTFDEDEEFPDQPGVLPWHEACIGIRRLAPPTDQIKEMLASRVKYYRMISANRSRLLGRPNPWDGYIPEG